MQLGWQAQWSVCNLLLDIQVLRRAFSKCQRCGDLAGPRSQGSLKASLKVLREEPLPKITAQFLIKKLWKKPSRVVQRVRLPWKAPEHALSTVQWETGRNRKRPWAMLCDHVPGPGRWWLAFPGFFCHKRNRQTVEFSAAGKVAARVPDCRLPFTRELPLQRSQWHSWGDLFQLPH